MIIFHGLIKDLNTMGIKLENAKESYDNVIKKLSTGKGNLIKKVENLKTLGAKAK
jgi:DNA recombination protein RmuC